MKLEIDGAFRISGRGIVVTGIPDAEPRVGPAVLWLADGTTHPVEITGVEMGWKLLHPREPAPWLRGVGVNLSPRGWLAEVDDLAPLIGCVVEQGRS